MSEIKLETTDEALDFMSQYIVSISPFAELFLEIIAKDYNLPIEILKKKYLFHNKRIYHKTLKKFKPKKHRKIHAYNVFLSDKVAIENLLKENDTENQTQINKEKGDLWKTYKKNKDVFQKYNYIADLENRGLLTKQYRNEILKNWEKYEKPIRKLSKSKSTDITLNNVLKKLNLNV